MSLDLTDEELDAVWDDESGTPSPMTAAEMDARLLRNAERLREKIREQETQNAQLADLVTRYTRVLQDLRTETERTELEDGKASIETRRLRDTLLRLAENSVAVARTL